ncbi:MAG: phosphatidate cytidylyltransferase [Anaeroplasma sp.]
MKKRVITGIIMALILIPVVLVPQLLPLFEVVVLLLGVIASCELLHMYDKEKNTHFVTKILVIVLTLVLYASIVSSFSQCQNSLVCKFLRFISFDKIVTPTTSICAIFIILMTGMVFTPHFEVSDIGKFYLAIIYVGVSLAAFTVLRFLGVRFVIYLLIVSITTDIFALVFGLTFGKHKMAPKISPKKTWEGAIGGTITAVIIGTLFLYLYPHFSSFFHDGNKILFFENVFNYNEFTEVGKVFFSFILSTLISICSQTGDLVASKLKRNYGIKDYSNVFPGHGGVLDRFDSTLFASAIFLLFILAESNLFPWVL